MHVPEPWFQDGQAIWTLPAGDGKLIAGGLSKEVARRIVACVNVCAGLDTEALEQMGQGGLARQMADTGSVREADELLRLLAGLLEGDVGRQTLSRLADGQGIDTEDGRAWLEARAKVGTSTPR